jgi:hypothetical protein
MCKLINKNFVKHKKENLQNLILKDKKIHKQSTNHSRCIHPGHRKLCEPYLSVGNKHITSRYKGRSKG